jgi:hypothetical protein
MNMHAFETRTGWEARGVPSERVDGQADGIDRNRSNPRMLVIIEALARRPSFLLSLLSFATPLPKANIHLRQVRGVLRDPSAA